jgi:hypothetical protein
MQSLDRFGQWLKLFDVNLIVFYGDFYVFIFEISFIVWFANLLILFHNSHSGSSLGTCSRSERKEPEGVGLSRCVFIYARSTNTGSEGFASWTKSRRLSRLNYHALPPIMCMFLLGTSCI